MDKRKPYGYLRDGKFVRMWEKSGSVDGGYLQTEMTSTDEQVREKILKGWKQIPLSGWDINGELVEWEPLKRIL